MLTVLAGKRRGIDPEDHRDRWLVNDDPGQRTRIGRRGDRVADVDSLDAGEGNDVSSRGDLDRDLLQTLKGVELCDLRLRELSVVLADADLITDGDGSIEDPADRESADVFTVVEVGEGSESRSVRRLRRDR